MVIVLLFLSFTLYHLYVINKQIEELKACSVSDEDLPAYRKRIDRLIFDIVLLCAMILVAIIICFILFVYRG